MVPLFVPEETWGPRAWGVNHPLYVQGQIEHGLDEAEYGYWGFSPSNNPAGGYREYGVDALGMDARRLHLRPGAHDCRPGLRGLPTARLARADDVRRRRGHPARVVPRLRYAPEAALANLAKLRADFDAYGPGGFYDAVAVAQRRGLASATSRSTRA